MIDHSAMKLGKMARRDDERTVMLSPYIRQAIVAPGVVRWSPAVTVPFPMMLNDKIGDCTLAAVGHMQEVWTANLGPAFVASDESIVNAYEAITGYNPADPSTDRGAVELSVLNFWRNRGIGQHKILGYAAIGGFAETPMPQRALDELREAIFAFGGAYIGIALPVSAQRQDVWDAVSGESGVAGSWGGHAVNLVDYDESTFTCVTWGALKKMTVEFVRQYVDEAYGVLSEQWIAANGEAPSNIDLATLTADLAAL